MISPGSADAAKFFLSYTPEGEATPALTAYLTAEDTPNIYGSYTVVAGHGFVHGATPIWLVPNPDAPDPGTVFPFSFDNALIPSGDGYFLSDYGLLFATAGGGLYNLGSFGGYSFLIGIDEGPTEVTSGLTTITAVPEPNDWLLLLTGFGLVGLAFRRQAALIPIPA